jgi:hypothetical protein
MDPASVPHDFAATLKVCGAPLRCCSASSADICWCSGELMLVLERNPTCCCFSCLLSCVTQDYTNQGLRVLAVACREVTGLSHPSEALTLTQDQLEEGAACLGLVLMVNRWGSLQGYCSRAQHHQHRPICTLVLDF